MDVDHTLNLGGLETFPTFFPDPDDIDPHFEGCMRNLKLNGKEYPLTVEAGWRGLSIGKVEKILKGSLDSISSPSPSWRIQIMGGKVCLRCKSKTLLGIAN